MPGKDEPAITRYLNLIGGAENRQIDGSDEGVGVVGIGEDLDVGIFIDYGFTGLLGEISKGSGSNST